MIGNINTLKDFKKGDKVRFVPDHAKEVYDRDYQNGVVSSVTTVTVFVKYFKVMKDGSIWPPIKTGDEPYTAASTNPRDLIKGHRYTRDEEGKRKLAADHVPTQWELVEL